MKKKTLVLIFLISCFSLFLNFPLRNSKELPVVALEQVATEEEAIDYASIITSLRETYSNDEIVGILRIPNEDYQRVITKSNDNSYYLTHDVNKNYTKQGNPFLDYRVTSLNSSKILIYGHNSSSKDAPFSFLENYYDESYYKEHPTIEFLTEEGIQTYEIFSVHVETSDWGYMKLDFETKESFLNHLRTLKERSMYDTGIELSEEDQVLILQTCSNKQEYRGYPRKYLLIIGRKVSLK